MILTDATNAINLQEAYPITNEEAEKLTPYTFTIENTCADATGYAINLESFTETDYDTKWLPDSSVRTSLVSGSNKLFFDDLYETYLTEEKVIENTVYAYKIHKGILNGKESKQFSLRLWLDYDTPASEDVMNATWQGKITVIASSINNDLPVIQTIGDSSYDEEFWNPIYKEKISKIIMEDNIHEIDNAIESWNVAEDKIDETKRVMAYLAPSEVEGLFTLYLQGNGGIKANEDSNSFFGAFTSLETIEGLEHFDTSNVVNMWAMFSECSSLKSLDLSSFDTSNVTEISLMFNFCNNLTNLNLGNLNLTKVTGMSMLFHECQNLKTTINITNPNITTYEYMLTNAAINEESQIIINYTQETSDLVDQMILTKSENSNIIKDTLIQ